MNLLIKIISSPCMEGRPWVHETTTCI